MYRSSIDTQISNIFFSIPEALRVPNANLFPESPTYTFKIYFKTQCFFYINHFYRFQDKLFFTNYISSHQLLFP